jgi:hypothetical protein
LPTTYGAPGQLTAELFAADLLVAGERTVQVQLSQAAGFVSNPSFFTIRNRQPVLVALSPDSGIVNTPTLELQVEGQDFVAGATLLWNGTPQPTTYVDSTRLVAQVAGTELHVLRDVGVVVANPEPSEENSNVLPFSIKRADQIIDFDLLPSYALADFPLTLSAMASSGLPVTFSSSTPGVCTVIGSMVTLVSTGTCTIVASQAGNDTYNPAVNVSRSFTVQPSGDDGNDLYLPFIFRG